MSEEPTAYQCSKDGSTIPAAQLSQRDLDLWANDNLRRQTEAVPARDKTQCPYCEAMRQTYLDMAEHLAFSHPLRMGQDKAKEMSWTDGYQR